MIARACSWLARRLPRRVLLVDGAPQLERYYVLGAAPLWLWPGKPRTRLGWLPFAVYLHRFLLPDEDRDLHNHPWRRTLSVVLAGGYEEARRDGRGVVLRRVRPGNLNALGRHDFHRVTRLLTSEAWTLFVTGRYVGTWSFWERETDSEVPWRVYLSRRRKARRSGRMSRDSVLRNVSDRPARGRVRRPRAVQEVLG